MSLSRRDALRALAGFAGLSVLDGIAGAGHRTRLPAPAPRLGDRGTTELTGRLVFPSDADYDEARSFWDGLFSAYPRVVVFCENTDDVVNALRWARETDTAVRVRSGRHSLEGWSAVDGGIVIDVSAMNTIELNERAGTATVGTGANQGQIVNALAGTGFGFPTGDEATVGLGGVTLGGGIGLLSRSMGAACDNLLSVEMVVPSGARGARVVRADERRNRDLLWACRGGGGGNFGIATSFTLKLHEVPAMIASFEVDWPFDALADSFDAWQRWAPKVANRLGSNYIVQTPDNGVTAVGIYLGSEEELHALLEPILEVPAGTPMITTTTITERFISQNSGPRQFSNWKFTPSWAYQPLPAAAFDVIADLMRKSPTPACNYWCLSWGGVTKIPPEGGSAFFHRDPLYYAEPGAGWNDPALTTACMGWVSEFRQAMLPYVEGGYVNVPDRAIADWGTAYYGSHFARLRRIKAKYDPDDVFQFEQSIPVG